MELLKELIAAFWKKQDVCCMIPAAIKDTGLKQYKQPYIF
jgi:hypothetical protein